MNNDSICKIDEFGSKKWYKNGKLHREYGPAIEYINGSKIYYYKDKEIDCDSTEEFLQIVNLKVFG
ncbi:MAG: hypothetical protein ACOYLO_00790 [Ferruginibacter sp.]